MFQSVLCSRSTRLFVRFLNISLSLLKAKWKVSQVSALDTDTDRLQWIQSFITCYTYLAVAVRELNLSAVPPSHQNFQIMAPRHTRGRYSFNHNVTGTVIVPHCPSLSLNCPALAFELILIGYDVGGESDRWAGGVVSYASLLKYISNLTLNIT